MHNCISEPSEIREIASAYSIMLRTQQESFLHEPIHNGPRDYIHYYLVFDRYRQELGDTKTRIYSVAYPGKSCVILNHASSLERKIKLSSGEDVNIFFEVSDDQLVLKYYFESNDTEARERLTNAIRVAARSILPEPNLLDVNRHRRKAKSNYYTSFKFNHDFGNIDNLEKSLLLLREMNSQIVQIQDKAVEIYNTFVPNNQSV